jgi:hypothetical protein
MPGGSPVNMAQVRDHIIANPHLNEEDRTQSLWALRMLASLHRVTEGEAAGDVLARIPVGADKLRGYLVQAHAARKGYAHGTWRNMRWGIFKSLRLSGLEIRVTPCTKERLTHG